MAGMKLALLMMVFVSLAQAASPKPHSRRVLRDYVVAEQRYFVGCRPSIDECSNSCPDHRAQVEENRELCDPDTVLERWACFCLFQGET
jgi:hypothetical protein